MWNDNGSLLAETTKGPYVWKNYFDILLNVEEISVEDNLGKLHTCNSQIDEFSGSEIESS